MMFELLVATVTRTTALLLAVWLVAVSLRRSSAAVRHLVWSAGLIGALAVPVLTLAPGFEVLPSWLATASEPRAQTQSVLPMRIPALPPANAAATPIIANDQSTADADTPLTSGPGQLPPAAIEPGPNIPWREAIVTIWIVGAAWFSLRLLLALRAALRLVRHSAPTRDTHILAAVERARRSLGVARSLRVVSTDAACGPMTFGWISPTIILPRESEAWDAARLDAVLLHEIAHVRRFDCLVQLAVRFSRACYWVHPLAWLAARRVHIEQERACDDAALRCGVRPSQFADHLVHITVGERAAPRAALVTTAIGNRSELLRRVRYLLDASHVRGPASRRVRAASIVAVTISAAAIGTSRTVSTERPEQAESTRTEESAQTAPTSTAPDIATPTSPTRDIRPRDPQPQDPEQAKLAKRLVSFFDLQPHRKIAIAQLVRIGSPAIPALRSALQDDRSVVVQAAAQTLAQIGQRLDRDNEHRGVVRESLLPILAASKHTRLTDACLSFLGADLDSERTVAALRDIVQPALEHRDWSIIELLASRHPHRALTATKLAELLSHSDFEVVKRALFAIEGPLPKAGPLRERVAAIQGDPARSRRVRTRAEILLGTATKPSTFLVTDYSRNAILRVRRDGEVLETIEDQYGVWDCEPLPNGHLLVVQFAIGSVVELDKQHRVVWEYDQLKNPYDADRLPNGNTLIADTYGDRVVEVDRKGKHVRTLALGTRPIDVERLPNGNTLVVDGKSDSILEIDPNDKVVRNLSGWEGVWDVDALANGHLLVTQRRGSHRVVELDANGKIVFQILNLTSPSDADRLPNGNTIVACDGAIIEFDGNAKKVWRHQFAWAVEVNAMSH